MEYYSLHSASKIIGLNQPALKSIALSGKINGIKKEGRSLLFAEQAIDEIKRMITPEEWPLELEDMMEQSGLTRQGVHYRTRWLSKVGLAKKVFSRWRYKLEAIDALKKRKYEKDTSVHIQKALNGLLRRGFTPEQIQEELDKLLESR